MSKFTVHVSRCQWQNVSIEIEAPSEKEAERLALGKAENADDADWEDGEAENYYVSETEEVENDE